MLGVSILVVLVGFIIPVDSRYPVIADAAFWFAGVSLLLKNGKFIYSKYARYVSFSIGLFIIAILFKILHLVGADILLVAFPVAVTLIYVLWFITKPVKQILDVLKLLWVPVFMASVIVKMLHYPYAIELYIAHMALFVAMLSIFISKNFKQLINS